MLEQAFQDVYTKFKLHFYQNVFQRFATREATLTTVESFCMEGIMAMGEPTIAEFSRMMQISTPNAAYKIGSLVKKGYVEKIQSTVDRREYHLRPTQKYIDYYNISYSYLSTVVRRVRQRFPEEDVDKLEQMLTIISDALREQQMQQTNEQLLVRPQSPVLRALRAAAPQTLPVLAGYFVLGLGYGIYVQSLGLPVWMPMLMGTVVYGGSLEFVLASLLLGAFSPLSAFLMALMIQARHLFYGLAMLERYKGYGLRSFYMIFAMSDETFSITCSAEPPEGVDKGWFMFFITLLDQFYWVASAGLGAAVGSVLPFSTEGVDFVMTAMFTVIFLNQWEKDKQHYSALIGIAAPLVCLAVFGSGSFLLPAMACILVLLLALRKPIEKAEGTEADKRKEETGV